MRLEKNKFLATLVTILEINIVTISLMVCNAMLVRIVTLIMHILFLKYRKYLPDLLETYTELYSKFSGENDERTR